MNDERISLTEEQRKAFESLKRAYKKCKKSGIKFHIVLETMYAVNGDDVGRIVHDCQDVDHNGLPEFDDTFDTFNSISDHDFVGFSDDTHYVVFKK